MRLVRIRSIAYALIFGLLTTLVTVASALADSGGGPFP